MNNTTKKGLSTSPDFPISPKSEKHPLYPLTKLNIWYNKNKETTAILNKIELYLRKLPNVKIIMYCTMKPGNIISSNRILVVDIDFIKPRFSKFLSRYKSQIYYDSDFFENGTSIGPDCKQGQVLQDVLKTLKELYHNENN